MPLDAQGHGAADLPAPGRGRGHGPPSRRRAGDVPRGRRRRLDRRHRRHGARARRRSASTGCSRRRSPTGMGMVRDGARPAADPGAGRRWSCLRGAPIYSRDVPMELVTPTGAAILAASVEGFGELPICGPEPSGTARARARWTSPTSCAWSSARRTRRTDGAGRRRADRASRGVVLETNVDDLEPEVAAYVAGAPARRRRAGRVAHADRDEEGPSRPSRSPCCAPPTA